MMVSDITDFSLTKERVRALMQQRIEASLDTAFADAWTEGSLFQWIYSIMEHLIDYRSDVGGGGLLEREFDPYFADELVPNFLPDFTS